MSVTDFEVREHVAWITMNRPEVMNAMNAQLRYELSRSFDEVEKNDDIWIAVLTGAGGRAFSAGVDLRQR